MLAADLPTAFVQCDWFSGLPVTLAVREAGNLSLKAPSMAYVNCSSEPFVLKG